MDQQIYTITFDGISDADANRYASQLKNVLLDASPDVEVERRKDDPYTQDLGATLVLILGTSSVTAIAKAIADWLLLHRSVQVNVKNEKGEYIVKNLTATEAFKLIDLLSPKK